MNKYLVALAVASPVLAWSVFRLVAEMNVPLTAALAPVGLTILVVVNGMFYILERRDWQ
jgi:hypothetical protein